MKLWQKVTEEELVTLGFVQLTNKDYWVAQNGSYWIKVQNNRVVAIFDK